MIKKLTLTTIIILGVITCSANSEQSTFKININGGEYIISAANINDTFELKAYGSKYELTPLMFASYSGNYNLVKFSMDNGADINLKCGGGWTALMLASEFGHLEIVKYLIENGADVNSQDRDGWTALIEATNGGRLEVVKYLVENGADINIKDKNGNTALNYARTEGIKEVLRKAGAE